MLRGNKKLTQDEYDNTIKCETDLDKKVVKLGDLNELAYKNLILSMNINSSVRNVACRLIQKAKSLEFVEGNGKNALDRLVKSEKILSCFGIKQE